MVADPDAACHCFGGNGTANSTGDLTATALVFGENDSFLKTASLTVSTNAFGPDPSRPQNAHGGVFVDHNGGSHGASSATRRIYWESTVILLGEPNPVLTIDASGTITA